MLPQVKILMVEDSSTDAELSMWELKKAGIEPSVLRVETKPDFLQSLKTYIPDLILSDFSMPHFDGLSALKLSRELTPEIPFIFVSGTLGEENAIESLKRGATDYVLKTNLARLPSAVERALREKSERAERKKIEQDLNETRERFSLFMRYLPGLAFIKDADRRYRFVNTAWESFTEKSSHEVLGRTDAELWPEFDAMTGNSDRRAIEKDKPVQMVETFQKRGNEFSFLVHKFNIPDATGHPALIGGVAIDFTERVRAEEKIERLSKIQAFLSRINAAIVRIRNREELLHEACRIAVDLGGFNLAWVGMLDKEHQELRPSVWVGHDDGYITKLRRSIQPDKPESFGIIGRAIHEKRPIVVNDIAKDPRVIYAKEALQRGFRAFVCLPLLIEGEAIGAILLYSTEIGVFDQEEMRLLAELAGDVSFALEYINKQEQLDYFAYYDPLTGLPNRSLFHNRLTQSLHARGGEKRLIATVLLDLARFRQVNETLGRNAGDQLLREVGARLLRSNDTVARIGVDMFGLKLRGASTVSEVNRSVEAIVRACFTEPFVLGDKKLRVACRAGIALYPGDGADADAILRNAEAALRRSRHSADHIVFYAPEMNARVAEALAIETRLRHAIERREFVLHYQPKLSLASGRITGAEALIRWQDPDHGLIPPGYFIPVLEDTGMIGEVGRWVVEQAFVDMHIWPTLVNNGPRIAVNVSAIQLQSKDFVNQMIEVIQRGGNLPGRLELEITESAVMRNVEDSIHKLSILRGMAVTVAIDDFGTGYSSLSYLRKLPLDALKIDQSFVSGLTSGGEASSIVAAIIALGHSLKLKVVAEGVETEEQANALKLLGCDEVQGYLYGKPMPAVEIAKLLSKN